MITQPKFDKTELLRIYASVGNPSPEGFIPVREKGKKGEDGKYLFVYEDGTKASERRFKDARDFHGGFAAVQEEDENHHDYWVYINTQFENANDEKYQSAGDFHKHRAEVKQDGLAFHITDAPGLPPAYSQRYAWISPYEDSGESMVGTKNDEQFKIDFDGKRIGLARKPSTNRFRRLMIWLCEFPNAFIHPPSIRCD